jgi:hypothetical protein
MTAKTAITLKVIIMTKLTENALKGNYFSILQAVNDFLREITCFQQAYVSLID